MAFYCATGYGSAGEQPERCTARRMILMQSNPEQHNLPLGVLAGHHQRSAPANATNSKGVWGLAPKVAYRTCGRTSRARGGGRLLI